MRQILSESRFSPVIQVEGDDVREDAVKNPLEKLTRRQQYGITSLVVIVVIFVLGNRVWDHLRPLPLVSTMKLSQAGAAMPLNSELATPAPSPSATPIQELVVHVTGAVKKPGVYTFKNGQRLNDAIGKAGGFRADADQEALNLADKLQDADKLNVPVKAALREAPPHIVRTPGRREVITMIPPAPVHVVARRTPGRVLGVGANTSDSAAPAQKETETSEGEAKLGKIQSPEDGTVNINTADEAELQRLPGVGPAIARRIISHRQESGQFQALEDLKEVKGIGEKTFAKLKPLITI